jgi:hypothetical protein
VAPRWLAALLVGAAAAQAQPLVIDNEAEPAAPAVGAEQQAALARAGGKGVLSMRASSVSVEARWATGLQLPLARCDLLSPQSISQAMEALRDAVTAPAAASVTGGDGEIEVLWIDVDFVDLQPGRPGVCDGAPTAGVVLRPWHLRVSTEHLGDNVLPLARDALGTAYGQVPAPLRALDPGLTLRYDRAIGTALGVTLRAPLPVVSAGVEAQAQLQTSVDANYYLADGGLAWRAPHTGGALTEHRLRLAGTQRRLPLGDGVHDWNASDLGAGVTLKIAPTSRLWLDTGWQSGRDEVSLPGLPRETRDFDQWSNRLLADRLFAASLTYARAALWHESTRAEGLGGRSSRVAATVGLSREIRLAPGRLLGVDVGLSLGRASDDTPAERRFRGGSPAAEFLFDGVQSPALMRPPAGPALRSFGHTRAQLGSGAAARGGTRFWSTSFNVALPVARWYRPLIPDESTDLQIVDGQPPLTLKQLLMNQVNVTGPNMLAAELMRQGLPADEAEARARASLAEVQPAVRYLVEDAPIVALRPLLMFDAGGLSDRSTSADWAAVGLGAQLQLATARFEGGYMHTVSGPVANQARGSLVFRLSFQNLF